VCVNRRINGPRAQTLRRGWGNGRPHAGDVHGGARPIRRAGGLSDPPKANGGGIAFKPPIALRLGRVLFQQLPRKMKPARKIDGSESHAILSSVAEPTVSRVGSSSGLPDRCGVHLSAVARLIVYKAKGIPSKLPGVTASRFKGTHAGRSHANGNRSAVSRARPLPCRPAKTSAWVHKGLVVDPYGSPQARKTRVRSRPITTTTRAAPGMGDERGGNARTGLRLGFSTRLDGFFTTLLMAKTTSWAGPRCFAQNRQSLAETERGHRDQFRISGMAHLPGEQRPHFDLYRTRFIQDI